MVSVKNLISWGVPAFALTFAAIPFAQLSAQDAAAGDPVAGKAVFDSSVCGACHTLAAADASGPIGPSLDNNPKLTQAFVVGVVTNGAGAMPAYQGQLSEKEINDVAAYVLSAAAK